MARKKSMYRFKSQKKLFEGSYVYVKVKGAADGAQERIFILVSTTDKKDVEKFNSPKAAEKDGWVKV